MEKAPDRRKIVNVVVDWKAQLRLFIPFGLLFLVSVIVMVLMYQQVANLLADLANSTDLGMVAKVSAMSGHILMIASLGIVSMAGITLVTWLMYSHRIFGPVVPIRRHLANLSEGNYKDQVKLRKYDEFKDIADDLNALTNALASKGR